MVENEQKLAFTKLKLIEIIFYYYKTIRTLILIVFRLSFLNFVSAKN